MKKLEEFLDLAVERKPGESVSLATLYNSLHNEFGAHFVASLSPYPQPFWYVMPMAKFKKAMKEDPDLATSFNVRGNYAYDFALQLDSAAMCDHRRKWRDRLADLIERKQNFIWATEPVQNRVTLDDAYRLLWTAAKDEFDEILSWLPKGDHTLGNYIQK